MLLSQSLVFAFAAALPTKVLSQKDSVLTQVFEAPYLGSTEGVNVDFSTAFEFSGSAWSLEFPESDVHSVRFVVEYEDDPEKSYELRIGKGGQVYSLIGGSNKSWVFVA